MERAGVKGDETLLDCIVIGAGPGGLQAGIYLGRYNFRVMLFHSPGGRTRTRGSAWSRGGRKSFSARRRSKGCGSAAAASSPAR
jgi:cation diffusion facilitator CzcD-associated flavoprotein CzcO